MSSLFSRTRTIKKLTSTMLLGLGLTLILTSFVRAQTPPELSEATLGKTTPRLTTSLAADLVGYWKFDEGSGGSLLDASGNAYTITRNTGTTAYTTTSVAPVAFSNPYALDFSGTGSSLNSGSTPGLNNLQSLTIAFWARPDTIPSSGFARFVTLIGEKAVIRIQSGSLHFYMKIDGGIHSLAASGVLTTTAWQHIAGTYDGSALRLYVNGSQVGLLAYTGTVNAGSGIELSSGGESYDGRMDDLRIYNRALAPSEIAALAAGTGSQCYAEYTGDNITDFSSPDASAVRNALAAASAGSTVKVAGYCPGVTTQSGSTQVALITQSLTLAGGYTTTDWLTYNPTGNPTTLDALGGGRVISLTASATLQGFTLTNGYAADSSGGGLYTAQPITLTDLTFYSNTVNGTTGTREGGGAYLGGAATISGTAFLTNTAYGAGGGVALHVGNSYLTNTTFIGNQATNDEAGGLRVQVSSAVVADGLYFYNNRALSGGGGAGSWDGPGQLLNSQVVSNAATGGGGGFYFNVAADVSNTTFMSNSASNGNGGGAMFNNTAAITNATFSGNTAEGSLHQGGGAYFGGTATVAGATFNANTASFLGGGAFFYSTANVTGTIFTTNTAASNGGGAYFRGTVTVTNTTFSANTSNTGGGAYFINSATVTNTTFSANVAGVSGGGAYFMSSATLTNTTFNANTAGTDKGGGAYFENTTTLANAIFSANTAGADGGGAFFYDVTTVTNTTFSGNTARYGGGAWFDWHAEVANSVFSHNLAEAGGGAYLSYDDAAELRRFTNVLLAGNTATTSVGAALYHNTTSPLTLQQVTVASPTVASGSAICLGGNAIVNITNTLIASHTVGIENAGGTVNENYNLLSDVTSPYSGTILSGGNSITGTAAFFDTNDYLLTPSSAAIDAGTDTGVTSDYFGYPRPQGNGYDIGYVESPFASTHACSATPDNGATVYASSDASAVRDAVNAASSGSTVKIAGYCAGVSGGQVVNINKVITLRGGYTTTNWVTAYPTTQPTTLDAQGGGRVILANATATLQDFTLTNGVINGDGGGLYTSAPITLTDLTIYSNTATGDGGGAYLGNTANIDATTFSSNQAGFAGGGVATIGMANVVATTFISNTASVSGGGAQFNGSVTLSATTFTGNTSGFQGGSASFFNAASVLNSAFTGNTAASRGGVGYIVGGQPVQFVNVLFARNSAGSQGNVLYLNGGGLVEITQATVTSPTLTNGAAFYSVGPTLYITNTIVTSHTVGLNNAGGTVNENYNLFDAVTTPYNGAITSGGQSLIGDAAFYDTTYYTLTAASAAIDAGTDTGVTNDYFGNPRPQGNGYDIGYAESPYAVTHTYTITPTAGASGSITPGTPQTVNSGSSITFTIAANTGYHIVDVGVDGVSQGALSSYTFANVTTNHTITSAYAINTYTLTVATGGSGSGVVSPTVGVYTYPYGTIITPTAIANTGSTFAGWSGDCSGAGSCTIMMTGTKAITANFDIETVANYTLTITTAGLGSGVVTPTLGTHTYPSGSIITVTASATLSSYFSGWGGDCFGSVCVVTMTGDRSVIANFGQYRLYLPLALKNF
jgi:hypothetical protein